MSIFNHVRVANHNGNKDGRRPRVMIRWYGPRFGSTTSQVQTYLWTSECLMYDSSSFRPLNWRLICQYQNFVESWDVFYVFSEEWMQSSPTAQSYLLSSRNLHWEKVMCITHRFLRVYRILKHISVSFRICHMFQLFFCNLPLMMCKFSSWWKLHLIMTIDGRRGHGHVTSPPHSHYQIETWLLYILFQYY